MLTTTFLGEGADMRTEEEGIELVGVHRTSPLSCSCRRRASAVRVSAICVSCDEKSEVRKDAVPGSVSGGISVPGTRSCASWSG